MSVSDLERKVSELSDTVLEHSLRLGNGTESFERVHHKLAELDNRTTPRPPHIAKVVGIAFAIFSALATSLWGLSMHLNDRVTHEQQRDLASQHEKTGHQDVRDDMRAIQREQSLQSASLKRLETQQVRAEKKIDRVLERLPHRRRRRR